MKNSLMLAAVGEEATGPALLIVPSLVGSCCWVTSRERDAILHK